MLLGLIVGNAVIIDARDFRRQPDRKATDALRRLEIALEQRRRNFEHACDVVETVARIVRRQQLGDDDYHAEQIPDCVGVLAAIEAMERHGPARIGVLGGGGIERGLEPADELGALPRRQRRTIGRRHHSCAQLANDGFPQCGVGMDIGEADRFQRQPPGDFGVVVAVDAVLLDQRLLGEVRRLAWPARTEQRAGSHGEACANTRRGPRRSTCETGANAPGCGVKSAHNDHRLIIEASQFLTSEAAPKIDARTRRLRLE